MIDRLIMRYAFITLLLLVIGCHHPKHENYVERLNPDGPSHLRIRNSTGRDISKVHFQGNQFGSLKKDWVSEYQPAVFWSSITTTPLPGDVSDRLILVELEDRKLGYVRPCARGSGRLAKNGHWTFTLTITTNEATHFEFLDISSEHDAK